MENYSEINFDEENEMIDADALLEVIEECEEELKKEEDSDE